MPSGAMISGFSVVFWAAHHDLSFKFDQGPFSLSYFGDETYASASVALCLYSLNVNQRSRSFHIETTVIYFVPRCVQWFREIK